MLVLPTVFTPRLCAALLCAVSLLAGRVAAKSHRISLAPAKVDRAGQVVSFPLPADAEQARTVRQADGTELPLQVAEGVATVFIPLQRAGETLDFTLTTTAPRVQGVDTQEEGGRLKFSVGGQAVVDYQMDKEALPRPDIKPEYKRAGYLHPIRTPSGTIVSDDYPAQHVHHHGIWSPWTSTSFQGRTPDFWNMGKKTGTVEFVALDRQWNGPVHGGFVARHRFVDLSAPSPTVALHETWDVRVYAASERERIFDLTITQTCATNDPLILPKFHYGGLGFRGRGEWLGRDKAMFLTSDGETDRVKANGKHLRWVHVAGLVEGGGTAGLAVLGNPGNFRAPQPVRVHHNEPYVSFTPSFDAAWAIEPGKPYVARYRFVAADGPPDAARLDALWHGYAQPAAVTVTSL